MIHSNQLVIATRQSPMALIQTKKIQSHLQKHNPQLTISLHPLSTKGDENTEQPLQEIGGKHLFVKELQRALLAHEADIAVNCIKDMSVFPTPGLTLSAICQRDDPSDAFVSTRYRQLKDLPQGATIGTASPRRQAILQSLRPDCKIALCRGNVNTRLKKLENNEFDAIILATAGLHRLGFQSYIQSTFDVETMIPAIGQGALGIECRSDDQETQSLIQTLHDPITAQCVQAERAVNHDLKGSCFSPIGAYATYRDHQLSLSAFVGSLDGQCILRAAHTSDQLSPEKLGQHVAQDLLNQGAHQLLNPTK